MSGDGSTASPTAMPFSTPPRSSRRKAEAENWDDDFEFALSSRPSSKTSSSQSKTAEKRRSSPVESLSEWWDESPPAPSRGRPAKAPSPLNLPAPTAQPPSLSPSQTTSLPPTPHTASRKPQIPFLSPSQAYAELGLPLLTPNASRPRSNSAASTTTRNKLIKRHPSSSAIPIPISQGNSRYPFGNSSLPSLPHPPLPRSDSGERMPPPPVPTSLTRTRQSQAKRFASRSEVRVSSIPFSLSQDAMREKETEVRRFSLWKRLSWVSPSRKQRGEASPLIHWSRSDPVIEEDSTDLRRRTSSLGNHHPDMTVASPSFPSIHLDLRSSSAVSSDSTPSASTSSSDPHSIMHRSTSNLFRRAENRKSSPPPSYPYQMNDDRSSSTLLQSPPTASPFARSVSRGFHLPSPSPWSPYHGGIIPGEGGTPPLPHSSSFLLALLPHSNSFPAPRHGRGDRSDTETETEKDDATPKRRRKSRPVSALPPTRTSSRTSWEVEGWNGFNREMTGPTSPRRVSSGSDSNGSVATTTSTLKKLGSLSKKHGRRLSGGFKFGTDSSSSSNESRFAAMGLETIEGSPSKPLRNRDGISSSSDLDEDFRSAVRAGSVSAPSSVIKPPIPEESSKAQEKQRRRQSWNDFVIPQEVLEKQKGVRKGIATAKRFAGGVETLNTLFEQRATLQQRVSSDTMRAWKRLEKEYAQWWAMATMLVAVGATGQETSQPSPKKSRRITLANDEAKYASEAMLEFAGLDANTPRKGSLPDPIDTTLTSGPRKASPPDQFNSIGRYDLSKRQAEVLRNMLRSPKSAGRPGMGPRQTSALSTTSTGSSILPTQQVHSPSISLPSPGDSSYMPPTESFPLPPSLTAGVLSRPVPTKRRSSRGGLVGLKEFLRSLKSGSGASSSVKAPRRAEFPPAGLTCTRSTKRSESGVHLPSSNYANAATAAFPAPANPSFPRSASPASPTRPTFHPACRSSFFSALGPARPRDPSPTQEPIPTSRPTLRNIFRSSSGIWSNLIRGPPSQVPPLPTRNIARSSLEEEDTVDGLLIGPRRSAKRSKATRNLRQQADEEADHKIRGTVNKSRIVGLGWPEEPSPKLSSSPTWGQSSTALPEEIQLEHGDCQENLEEGMEEEDLAVMPEDLPVLLEYMRECEGKLGEWRRKVEELLV